MYPTKLRLLAACALLIFGVGCSLDEKVNAPGDSNNHQGRADKNGTEALGAPDLELASGSGIAEGGIGMVGVDTGAFTVTVPADATVRQVFLYWAGGAAVGAAGDNVVTLNDHTVEGQLIGGPTWFYDDYYFSAYRADITEMGLIGSGVNLMTISDFHFTGSNVDENSGASVLVIYDDGSGAEIGLRDGLDMAYFGFGAPLNATVPQVFSVSPAAEARTADLVILAASVGANRPNRIVVTTTAGEQVFDDVMGSVDEPQWDSLVLPVVVPADATELTVELVSPYSYEPQGASLGWVCAGLVVPVVPVDDSTWVVAGTVFVDTDRDGLVGATEAGLPGVIVDLIDGSGMVATATSGLDGSFSFVARTGTYTLTIDLGAHPEAFNADLAASFEATGLLSRTVTTGPDSGNNDFGFVPDADLIVAAVAAGTITSDGLSEVAWRRIFRCALIPTHNGWDINNGSGNSRGAAGKPHIDNCGCDPASLIYTEQQLLAYLEQVEGLFLPDPYVFQTGKKVRDAYQILRSEPKTDNERLYQELLVTELNYVVGRGAIGQEDLMEALMAWSESLLVLADAEGSTKSVEKGVSSDVVRALKILESLNTGGGGGVDE